MTDVTEANPSGLTPLPAPQPLSQQSWPEGTRPRVSILCVTYQHLPFIARCLDGFLMQETTFPVEILVHDDASTDGTAEIVRSYADRYPNLIRPTLQKENQYSQGKKPFLFLMKEARGEFLALCEGDDYWSHPRKLERQNDAFRQYPQAVICGHDVSVVQPDQPDRTLGLRPTGPDRHQTFLRTPEEMPPPPPGGVDYISQEEAMRKQLPQTLSLLFRNLPIPFGPRFPRIVVGDCYLMSQLCVHGGIVYLPEVMGVYNVHGGGVYSTHGNLKRSGHLALCYRALMWEIAPQWAPAMAVCTARFSQETVREALLARQPREAFRFFGLFFSSVGGAVRGLKGGVGMMPRVVAGLLEIAAVPWGYLFGFVERKLRARSGGPEGRSGKGAA